MDLSNLPRNHPLCVAARRMGQLVDVDNQGNVVVHPRALAPTLKPLNQPTKSPPPNNNK